MDDGSVITRWAAAVLALPFTEEVVQSVGETFLQIAGKPSRLPHIPIGSWGF
jgi:hypothetical protein